MASSDSSDAALTSLPLPSVPLRVAPFCSVRWIDEELRATWGPRLQRIKAAWSELEWRSVASGIRSCALDGQDPRTLGARSLAMARHGLVVLPLGLTRTSNGYANAGAKVKKPGTPFDFRVVIGRGEDALAFHDAWAAADDEAMGVRLGYPVCCRRFFAEVWVRARCIDTSWAMASRSVTPPSVASSSVASQSVGEPAEELVVSGNPRTNILWRWAGLRCVPHLPCSFDCEPSSALARALEALGRAAGFGQELDWLLELLDWPVEWRAERGVARIRTPLLEIETDTDPSAGARVVRRLGAPPPRSSAAVKEQEQDPEQDWYWRDNGFSSPAAMRAAHAPIVARAAELLGAEPGRVLDLGCGNGALLRALRRVCPRVEPFGIEIDPERAAHARFLLPEHAAGFVVGDLTSAFQGLPRGARFRLALLMPGRLLEAGEERSAALRAFLAERCEHLLVYAYGDWLERHGGIAGLCARAGLRIVELRARAPLALAEVEPTRIESS